MSKEEKDKPDNFWFKHDFDARNGLKLMQLRMEVGPVSDGIYWDVIEIMYREGGQISLKTIPAIAKQLNTTEDLVNKVVRESALFEVENGIFFSQAVKKRLQDIQNKRDHAASAANVRHHPERAKSIAEDVKKKVLSSAETPEDECTSSAETSEDGCTRNAPAVHSQCTCNALAMHSQCTCNAPAMQPAQVSNASRVEYSKENQKIVNCSPTGDFPEIVEQLEKPPKEKRSGPSQEVLDLMAYYYQSYEDKFAQKYFARNFPNDSKIFEDLIKCGLDPSKIPGYINAFFAESEDKFVLGSTYTTGLFKSVIHKYTVKADPKRVRGRILGVK